MLGGNGEQFSIPILRPLWIFPGCGGGNLQNLKSDLDFVHILNSGECHIGLQRFCFVLLN